MYDNPNIIIDNGTGYCKAGFSNEEEPRVVFPAFVGKPKNRPMFGAENKDSYVGFRAQEKRGVLDLKYPIEHGIVNDWDDMEKVWEYTFTEELRATPDEHNVMLTEAPLNPKENREKMGVIMFETFNVEGLYIGMQSVLSLYSAGKSTAIVCDSGEGVTQFVPIIDGSALPNSIVKMNLAGRELTEYLIDLLKELGLLLKTTGDREIAKDIKEKACYVALDFNEEWNKFKETNYEMPDGSILKVKDQRFRASELLFHPETWEKSKERTGVDAKCNESINKCDANVRKDLYGCILLSGGTTMLSGFTERFTKEIKALAPQDMKENVKVIDAPKRKDSVWIGGKILSTRPGFKWVTKDEYNESGISIIHKDCF